METHPETVVLGGHYRTVSPEDQELGVHRPPESDGEIRWHMLFNNAFCHSAVMFRRSALDGEPFAYDETLTCAQDYDLWMRLLGHGEGANLPAVLVERSVHDHSMSEPALRGTATPRRCDQPAWDRSVARHRARGPDRCRAIEGRAPMAVTKSFRGAEPA